MLNHSPNQRILVHRVDISQVRDTEEQHGAVLRHRHVQEPGLVYLGLRDGGGRLLGLDLDGEHPRRRQDQVR